MRSTARLCEIQPNTVLSILVLAGERCERLLGDKLRNVPVSNVQADEIWSFIGKKEKRLQFDDAPGMGDCYTFVAIERDTKLVLNFTIWASATSTPRTFSLKAYA